jgi:hypothetical protein
MNISSMIREISFPLQKLFSETAVTLNTKALRLFCVLALIQIIPATHAQSIYQVGVLPSLNFNLKLKNGWSLNTKIESRQRFTIGTINGEARNQYKYILTDLSFIAAKKVGLNSRLAGGYMMRFAEGELYHRFIQQYVIVHQLTGFRLSHRFSGDETFSEGDAPEFRLRYRISAEIPLNGEAVDPGEFYFKISNEYLNSWQAGEYDLEIRAVPLLGFDFTDNFKSETGLDYRISSFLNGNTKQIFWVALNFFLEI